MASTPPTPEVRLGQLRANGIAATMFALLERGVQRHPALAGELRGRIVLRFAEGYVPVRMTFGKRVIRVEDGDLRSPDVAISGRLPDVVHLATTPFWMGMPDPRDSRGRGALLHLALRRVRVSGDRRLARALLELMALRRDPDSGGRIALGDEPSVDERRWIDVLV